MGLEGHILKITAIIKAESKSILFSRQTALGTGEKILF
jgi:hypothetical protein